MKLSLVLAMLIQMIFFSCISIGQDKVPQAVKDAFVAKYPGESDPDWHLDRNGNFESNFKIKNIHYKADFDITGQWIETENRIKKSDLPDAVKSRIKDDYDDYKIVEIESVDHNSKGHFYDVEFIINGKKQDVEFNDIGEIIN